MSDLQPGEIVYVPFVNASRLPDAHRYAFVRVAESVRIPKIGKAIPCFVLRNDKGTESKIPVRYTFKCREDALDKASEMVH